MINLDLLYIITGLMFVIFGLLNFKNPYKNISNKIASGIFWISYGITFLFANLLPSFITGLMVIILALIALTNIMQPAQNPNQEKETLFEIESAKKYGNKLFIPALFVPLITLVGTFLAPYIPFIGNKNQTLIALVFAILVSFCIAIYMFKASPIKALHDGANTMDEIGWAALLPQILATLGIIFLNVGISDQVAGLLSMYFSFNSLFFSVAFYTFSVAIFTIIMGNAFAAFPVITAAIAIPILINKMGGDPTIIGAIGMLSGFCGTLMTPMAANFNIIPVALLNIDDKNAVIKVQFLSGMLILIANTLLIYFLAF